MFTNHTPGPWKEYELPRGEYRVISLSESENQEVVATVKSIWDTATTKANARLVAKAPELWEFALKAIPHLERLQNEWSNIGDIIDLGKKAIANAEEK